MQLKINNDIEKQMALAQLKIILDALEIYDGIKTDTSVVSVSQNNINTNKVSADSTEEPQPISYKETDTATIPSVKHQNHGGKRVGAGVKKGYQQTQEHKDKRLAKLKGNRNAAKNTDGHSSR